MAGTAGSKYGVVKDDVPVKNKKIKPRKRLKSLRKLLKRKADKNSSREPS